MLSKFGLFFVLHHLSFHSPIADRVRKDVIRLLTLQCHNDDTILKTCQTLTIRPGAYFSKVPKLFGRISGDIILFVSSKRRRLEARTLQLFLFLFPLQHIKRPALQNKQVRKVLGTFEKRAPGFEFVLTTTHARSSKSFIFAFRDARQVRGHYFVHMAFME